MKLRKGNTVRVIESGIIGEIVEINSAGIVWIKGYEEIPFRQEELEKTK